MSAGLLSLPVASSSGAVWVAVPAAAEAWSEALPPSMRLKPRSPTAVRARVWHRCTVHGWKQRGRPHRAPVPQHAHAPQLRARRQRTLGHIAAPVGAHRAQHDVGRLEVAVDDAHAAVGLGAQGAGGSGQRCSAGRLAAIASWQPLRSSPPVQVLHPHRGVDQHSQQGDLQQHGPVACLGAGIRRPTPRGAGEPARARASSGLPSSGE